MCLPLLAALPAIAAATASTAAAVAPVLVPALSIAGTTAGFIAQKQQADAQAHYEGQMYSQTGKIASQNYQNTISQYGVQGAEQAQASTQQAISNQVQGSQNLGEGQVAAAAQGVTGNSVNELFNNYSRLEAANNNNIYQNFQFQQQQRGQELLAARSQTQGQIASATPQPVAQPSALAAGLNIGASAFSGLNNYAFMKQIGPYSQLSATSQNPLASAYGYSNGGSNSYADYNNALTLSMLGGNGLTVGN